MAKSVLPSISKWEEVLDILLNPEKYKAYMVDFQAAYDKAAAILDLVTTKEEADQYLDKAKRNEVRTAALKEDAELFLASARQAHEAHETVYAETLKEKAKHERLTVAFGEEFAKLDAEKKKVANELYSQLEELRIAKEEFQCFREKHAEKVAEFELRVLKLNSLIGAV